MSVRVELTDLADVVAAWGSGPFLLTVREGAPRALAMAVRVADDGAVVGRIRRGTAAAIGDGAEATLLWPEDAEHPQDCLLVDGWATVTDGPTVRLEPRSAILHRRR